MGNKIGLILLSVMALSLSSCTVNHRTNYIVSGYYEGVNEYAGDDGFKGNFNCSLNILPISRDEYVSSNGINVVEDLVKPNYYRLELCFKYDGKDSESFYFNNLKDASNGSKQTPISYLDDNGMLLTPHNDSLKNETKTYYSLEARIKSDGVSYFVYCYLYKADYHE